MRIIKNNMTAEQLLEAVINNYRTDTETLKVAGAVKELYGEVKSLKAELETLKQSIKPSDSGLIDILSLFSHRLTGWTSGNSLYEHCRRIAEEEGLSFPYSSPRSLGNKLHREWSTLVTVLDCEKKKGKNNETLYYFPRE